MGGPPNDVARLQARRAPRKAILADQFRGTKTFRDVVLSVLVLKPQIEKLEGERVGILLPASVAATGMALLHSQGAAVHDGRQALISYVDVGTAAWIKFLTA